MEIDDIREAARILAHAKTDGRKLADLPKHLQPQRLDDSYRIQAEIVRLDGAVGGWKVSMDPDGEPPKIAPIRHADVLAQGSSVVPGPARLEGEFAVKFGAALPHRATPYSRAEVDAALASAYIVFEVLGTRFVDRTKVSKLSYLADGNGNQAVIVGDEISEWRARDLSLLPMVMQVDGQAVSRAENGASFEKILNMLTFLANHAASYVGGIRAGEIVITGARVGPTPVAAGREAMASINGHAKVTVSIV
jgi:2-keto-4-pentenoate hydratase